MKLTDHKKRTLRVILVGSIFAILYMAISARAVHLHIFKGPWLSQKAECEYKKSFTCLGKRGTIFDTNHKEMAVSVNATSIAANPSRIKNPRAAAKNLARILDLNPRKLRRKLSSGRTFVWIKRQVIPKKVSAVKNLELEGIAFIPAYVRVYPNLTAAAQVIGFSGIDGQGLEGLEFYYNSNLKGSTIRQTVMQDALGRGFQTPKELLPQSSGNNLILTIDQTIQYITESALEEAATSYAAKSGMAIVMSPKTGAILALAHFPRFNPNTFGRFHRNSWRNRAITDLFEPGSTMKIFLAAAAIESGKCLPSDIFFCENGRYKIDKNYIHDTHDYGWLSLQQIIKYSSNIGTAKVTEKIGKDTLYTTLRSFGFGDETGIDCPGEAAGALSQPSRWTRIDASTISFGQGISVSAIQLITAVASIANDGILMKPYIVKAITDENGRIIEKFSPQQIRAAVSPETAGKVKRIMQTVTTEGGTGIQASMAGYSVCGKTGTAQKIDGNGKYSNKRYIATFIGFAPAENPEIAILVIVDEPVNVNYGGIVAAPAFKKIAHETFNYLNISPRTKKGLKTRLATASGRGGTKG